MIVSKLPVQLIDEIINATNAYNSSRYMNLRYILKNSRTPRATMMNTNEREQLTAPAVMQPLVLLQGFMMAQEYSKICTAHARLLDTTFKYPGHAMEHVYAPGLA